MNELFAVFILVMMALLIWVIHAIIQNRKNAKIEAKAKLYKAQADLYNSIRRLYSLNMRVVDAMSGIEFEHFVAELLPDFGYRNIQVTKASGDGGADIIATNNECERVCIQCKKYTGSVGFDAVKEIYTAKSLYSCDVAMVVTNSYFTKQTVDTAQRLDVRLYDRDKLWSLMETSFELKLERYYSARDRKRELYEEFYDGQTRHHVPHPKSDDYLDDAFFQISGEESTYMSENVISDHVNELDK